MEVRSGPARIVGSGVATTFGGAPLVLVAALDGQPLEVELAFREQAGGEPSVGSEAIAGGYRLDCVNFADGKGTAEPVLVGQAGPLAEDLVFLHFHAFRHGASPETTVHWTLYRVAKAEVGWQPRGG
ncbi:MAG: hypothetical protein R3F59_23565 [Myxococcota bacterium]